MDHVFIVPALDSSASKKQSKDLRYLKHLAIGSQGKVSEIQIGTFQSFLEKGTIGIANWCRV